jgi:Zn-dependent protease/predicted transcriptional regulator
MKASFKLGRIFGIEIGIHFSWVFIALLIILSLGTYFQSTQTTWQPGQQWIAALLAALLFFSSLLAHEMGHSLVAKHYGINVRSITLFLFGGVSQLEKETERPLEEFWIAIAGPFVSLALASIFAATYSIFGLNSFVRATTEWLAGVNLALAIFNLLPGIPLDGGRVLHGFVWWLTGDRQRANHIAAETGQIIAALMIVTGVMLFFKTNNAIGGIWLVFLGWFLLDAARASEKVTENDSFLKDVQAGNLMSRDCPRVDGEMPLMQFINETILRTGLRCFLVAEGMRVVGIITVTDLTAVDRALWDKLTVADVMRPYHQLKFVSPEQSANDVLELMESEDINQVPVVANGRVLGIISREHFIRLLATRMELAAGRAGKHRRHYNLTESGPPDNGQAAKEIKIA